MVKLTVLEGSPEDVIAVARGLQMTGAAPTVPAVAPPADIDPDDKAFVSVEVARKVLNRRPLSAEQKLVLTTLGKAHPKWVPASQLQAATSYTPAQFAGLMGAFGRRFTHTEGYVPNTWLFDAEWDYAVGAYNYRLPETVLEAMRAEKLI